MWEKYDNAEQSLSYANFGFFSNYKCACHSLQSYEESELTKKVLHEVISARLLIF